MSDPKKPQDAPAGDAPSGKGDRFPEGFAEGFAPPPKPGSDAPFPDDEAEERPEPAAPTAPPPPGPMEDWTPGEEAQDEEAPARRPADRPEGPVGGFWPGLAPSLGLLLSILVWGGMVAASLWARPILPIDETRYLSVAWEMWLNGTWLVPHVNGEIYSHKPPLLFWLINLAWLLGGPEGTVAQDWVGRLAPTLFVPLSALLVSRLARLLWPAAPVMAGIAPLVLTTTLVVGLYGSLVMFDALLTFFVLLAVLGLVMVWRRGNSLGWGLVALGIGLGVLAKGPVVLVHVLPIALAAPLWQGRERSLSWPRWYLSLFLATLLGAVIALAWALPAAWLGGEAYANEILWDQVAGRVTQSFDHARPWWFFLPILPLAFYPWTFWPGFWRGLGALGDSFRDPGLRLTVLWLLLGLALISAISGKQPHYLFPLAPAFALLTARGVGVVGARPGWLPLLPPVLPVLLLGLLGALLPFAFETLAGWFPELPPALGEMDPLAMGALALAAAVIWFLGAKLPRLRVGLLAVLSLALFGLGQAAGRLGVFGHADLAPVASFLADHREAPIAFAGNYQAEFNYLARLERPVEVVPRGSTVNEWLAAHPEGFLVFRNDGPAPAELEGRRRFVMPFKDDLWIAIWQGPESAAPGQPSLEALPAEPRATQPDAGGPDRVAPEAPAAADEEAPAASPQ